MYSEAIFDFQIVPKFDPSLPRHHDFYPRPVRNKALNALSTKAGPIELSFRSGIPPSERARLTFQQGTIETGRHPLLDLGLHSLFLATHYELGWTLLQFQDPAKSTILLIYVLDVLYLPPSEPKPLSTVAFEQGDRVVIRHGQISGLGGSRAQVLSFSEKTLLVKLDDGNQEVEIDHIDAYCVLEHFTFEVGKPVVLSGLVGAKHLNGRYGTLKGTSSFFQWTRTLSDLHLPKNPNPISNPSANPYPNSNPPRTHNPNQYPHELS